MPIKQTGLAPIVLSGESDYSEGRLKNYPVRKMEKMIDYYFELRAIVGPEHCFEVVCEYFDLDDHAAAELAEGISDRLFGRLPWEN